MRFDETSPEFYLGLPAEVEDRRLGRIHAFKPREMLLHLDKMRPRMLVSYDGWSRRTRP